MSTTENNEKKVISRSELTTSAVPVLSELGYKTDGDKLFSVPAAEKQMGIVISDLAIKFSKLGELQMPIFGGWCAYAGMGCVKLLRDDEKAFEENGVVETLSEAKGFENMDEYVTELLGLGFETPASDKLISALFAACECVLDPLSKLGENDGELVFPQMQECFEAMYLIGVSLGVSILENN